MKQRVIASVIVFGVGFVVGLGATYTLLSRTPSTASTPKAPPAALTDTAVPPAPSESASKTPPALVSTTRVAAPVGEDKPNSKLADSNTTSQASSQNNKPLPPVEPTILPATTPGSLPADSKEEEKPAAAVKWWEGLVDTTCEIDLGRARALTIRKGKVKDGQITDWSAAFGSNPRIGLLSASERNIATVHGVAVDEQGKPIAAEISLKRKNSTTRGVIALHTQGLRVTLKPINP